MDTTAMVLFLTALGALWVVAFTMIGISILCWGEEKARGVANDSYRRGFAAGFKAAKKSEGSEKPRSSE